jgi:hypothetical protein
MTIPLYVVCRSERRAAEWSARGVYYPGFGLRPIANADSYYGVINDVLADAAGAVVIVHDDVWLGLTMETRVAGLIRELDRNLPNLGICGNAGTRWTVFGRGTYRTLTEDRSPTSVLSPSSISTET